MKLTELVSVFLKEDRISVLGLLVNIFGLALKVSLEPCCFQFFIYAGSSFIHQVLQYCFYENLACRKFFSKKVQPPPLKDQMVGPLAKTKTFYCIYIYQNIDEKMGISYIWP